MPPSRPKRAAPDKPGTPRGEEVAWSALGTLLAGPITWGFVGWLVDQAAETGRVFTALGVVLGSVTSMWVVYLRFGRD